MPEAKQYIFSLCYTGESSLQLKKLIAFDGLIAKYEGYLFSKNEISENVAFQILKELPVQVTQKNY